MIQMQRDSDAIEAYEQIESSLDLLHVDCDNAKKAIGLLFCGCRSVDERKISVGDDIVICVMRKDDDNIDGCNENDDEHDGSLCIRRFPSKKP